MDGWEGSPRDRIDFKKLTPKFLEIFLKCETNPGAKKEMSSSLENAVVGIIQLCTYSKHTMVNGSPFLVCSIKAGKGHASLLKPDTSHGHFLPSRCFLPLPT